MRKTKQHKEIHIIKRYWKNNKKRNKMIWMDLQKKIKKTEREKQKRLKSLSLYAKLFKCNWFDFSGDSICI